MNIQITSRREKVSTDAHDFIKKELFNLEKFHDRISSCHVIIGTEYVTKTVEITATLQGNTIVAKAKAENLGKAVDLTVEKLKRQLKKYNQRIKDHKNAKEKVVID